MHLLGYARVTVGADENHRHVLGLDQRDRAVLHLAGRVALGVDVRDLLELERALERDGVVDPPPEEEEALRVRVVFRDRHFADGLDRACSLHAVVSSLRAQAKRSSSQQTRGPRRPTADPVGAARGARRA